MKAAIIIWALFIALIGPQSYKLKPGGILGVKWGDDAMQAASKLGAKCDKWQEWEGKEGFEVCSNIDDWIEAYNEKALVRLVRKGARIEGVELRFQDCAAKWSALREAACKDFGLEPDKESGPYEVWSSVEAVRFAQDKKDDTCTLMVAGPQFGKAYGRYVIHSGLRNLISGMRPR
ncbi:MAG TPA: hypothetical protein VNN73_14785 [Blastocatellia bacterium]|nr:hypothetical protein [Blastocatellia bacterium]